MRAMPESPVGRRLRVSVAALLGSACLRACLRPPGAVSMQDLYGACKKAGRWLPVRRHASAPVRGYGTCVLRRLHDVLAHSHAGSGAAHRASGNHRQPETHMNQNGSRGGYGSDRDDDRYSDHQGADHQGADDQRGSRREGWQQQGATTGNASSRPTAAAGSHTGSLAAATTGMARRPSSRVAAATGKAASRAASAVPAPAVAP